MQNIVFWGCIGVMEEKMETTITYSGIEHQYIIT